jgi:hypothetical protein
MEVLHDFAKVVVLAVTMESLLSEEEVWSGRLE